MPTKQKEKTEFTEYIEVNNNKYKIYSLKLLGDFFDIDLTKIPYSLKVLLESQVRAYCEGKLNFKELTKVINGIHTPSKKTSLSYYPSRVIVQDYTGVPLLTDLAALRDAIAIKGGNFEEISPVIQTDIIVDHSIQVESSGSINSFLINTNKEYEQNKERYKIMKWAEKTLNNVRVFPPGSGIIHQINLENLATLVRIEHMDNMKTIIPDSVIGTDSHTTMINSLGILGWGSGGIEVESVMLGNPLSMLIPEVVGIELKGQLKAGVTTTDLVLYITEKLREFGVVNTFIEFYGSAIKYLNVTEKATIANMAPEFGATCAYFPIDEGCFTYLTETGRDKGMVDIAREYYQKQGLLYFENNLIPNYNRSLVLNLDEVSMSVSGPSLPQSRINIQNLEDNFNNYLKSCNSNLIDSPKNVNHEITHGSIMIAAITSCTNTSNPTMMIAAGLLAKKSYEKGLCIPKYVKTSFSPGSRVVTEYLRDSGLMIYLEKLGFHLTGYGCMTCSGSSGPLKEGYEKLIEREELIVASVLSGNRNFSGRIHPYIQANYLASPPLVIAYALAGKINIDLSKDPIGISSKGEKVFLDDIWPTQEEISYISKKYINKNQYRNVYKEIHLDQNWEEIQFEENSLYSWDESSTYIQRPPFFELENSQINESTEAYALMLLGDNITTDHISPGGRIGINTPAGSYLKEKGVSSKDFNTFGARRGNYEVMVRGMFGNNRLKNHLTPKMEGGYTKHIPSNEVFSIFDASVKYIQQGKSLIIIAGKEYGSGSSRDWAAKGTMFLGVNAVIAESFERIHKSNLIMMGVLPLQFNTNENYIALGLDGTETYKFTFKDGIVINGVVEVEAITKNNQSIIFNTVIGMETIEEIQCYLEGGILKQLLKKYSNKVKNYE